MRDSSFDDALNHVKSCSYYDTPSLIPRSTSNKLFRLHIIIRSLQNNFDNLINFVSQFTVLADIICITETRQKIIHSSILAYQDMISSRLTLQVLPVELECMYHQN